MGDKTADKMVGKMGEKTVDRQEMNYGVPEK